MSLSFALQYRIFLDSFFYLLGYCRQHLKQKRRMLSATEMVINKDDDLIKDFDANYEEVKNY